MTYFPDRSATIEIAGEDVRKTTDEQTHELLRQILKELRQVRLHLEQITNERFDR